MGDPLPVSGGLSRDQAVAALGVAVRELRRRRNNLQRRSDGNPATRTAYLAELGTAVLILERLVELVRDGVDLFAS